ncbi:AMP-binding protein [Runella slithyformis]|uniref:Long-chain-fatty-acid--CoA ligase n=1 Tax=Runella slithyformis (strain ATCC 29530 / DSM 19594 / LMG 11500 / NCIMB 11436 / LSU 4) TaxID=761193 RepID=A0A7U3ZGB5_RUNSL|nr:AMP-binding protein [Runella slithyformis]AEI46627.1 Long-chain-fatty-acid--CoA ligase [Runella slithyformis DSM 19594]
MTVTLNTFPWLKFYPPGMPYEIAPEVYPSLLEMMEEGFSQYAARPAYACMGKQITYAQLDKMSNDFAAYLQSVGLKTGDRIAIQMPNVLQYPVAMFGALRAGLTIVNTNPLYTPREMEHQFKDSGAKAIIILANFADKLEKVLPATQIKHVFVTQIGDMLGFPKKQIVNFVVKNVKKMVPPYHLPQAVSFTDAVQQGASMSYTKPSVNQLDLAFIQYTGGTTGVSKGAMLTHRNIIANVEANCVYLSPMLKTIPENQPNVIVAALPLYHVYALTCNALSALKNGGMNLLITNPRDMEAFIKELKKYKVTVFTGLNTLYNGLMNHPKFGEIDFSQLKITSAGGMALQKVVAERWYKLTGNLPTEGYGLSETSPVLSANPLDPTLNRIGTIGIPFPSTEMRILREDDTWADVGEPGEICAFGPQVMPGYYNRPDETAKVMLTDPADGRQWFKTGDIGVMDSDGYFKIVDRKKDMVLVSGFNVYPNEVEDVVAQCPGVLEVACVGVPDEKTGEAVKIFVVKKDESLTKEQVIAFCRENLTAYKCPKHIEFRPELPKTNVGKILRRALRDEPVK